MIMCYELFLILVILFFLLYFICLGMPNGLKICVCKKTKSGIYKGQLVKVDSALNGGNYTYKYLFEYILRYTNSNLYGT